MEKHYSKEQQNEINAHVIYKKLSGRMKDPHNKQVLKEISDDELKHYNRLKAETGLELKPNYWTVQFFYFLSIIFGITFGVKLMEKTEDKAKEEYGNGDPVLEEILKDEEKHEQYLINMIDEKKLNYMGSIVLGLNDALVELTGALAGYTFAFQNTKLIALTGLITGISASFSMAASEFLSTRQEEEGEEGGTAGTAALYTGIAYVLTVVILILPFLLIQNPFVSLITTLVLAVLIIFAFNYYISVAKDLNFKRRFFEMAGISLGVAAISFVVGIIVKQVFGIDI